MNIAQILSTNYPEAEWTLIGTDYDGLEWLDKSPKPTEDELQSQWSDVQYKTEVEAIRASRQAAYVAEADPLNFKWQETQLDVDRVVWLEKKDEIRARFPDPVAPKVGK